MRIISYIVIMIVVSIIGWTTNNSLHTIFYNPKAEKIVESQPIAKVVEKSTVSGMLDNLLSE